MGSHHRSSARVRARGALIDGHGHGSFLPATVTPASVNIPAGDTSDEDLYFYFSNTAHPQGHWAKILQKVRSDGLPMQFLADSEDAQIDMKQRGALEMVQAAKKGTPY